MSEELRICQEENDRMKRILEQYNRRANEQESEILRLKAELGHAKGGVSKENFLLEENNKMRESGNNLAMAALQVIKDHDGIHRLALALSDWCKTMANEGGRPH